MNLYDIIDKFEYRHGDIFKQLDLHYIAHQCNCFHCMGAGVAGQIAKLYPEVSQHDKAYTKCGDKNKLGKIQVVNVIPKNNNYSLHGIINMYSQFEPGCYKTNEEYNERLKAIESCLIAIKDSFDEYIGEVVIGFPYLIGCGISGLAEKDVMNIFNKVFDANSESHVKIVFIDHNKIFELLEQM